MTKEDDLSTIPDENSFVLTGKTIKQCMAIINALRSGNRDRIFNTRFAATDELYQALFEAKELPMAQAKQIAAEIKKDKRFQDKAKELAPDMFNKEEEKNDANQV